jgi:transcriptional regulator with XRE-family HTH domain
MYKLYIEHYRKLRRLTQQQLANKCEIDRSYVSKLEQDNAIRTHSPKLDILEKLALEMKVCPNDILRYLCLTCSINSQCKRKEHIENENPDDEHYYNNV